MEIRTIPRPTCLICGSEGGLVYNNLQDRMFAVPGSWSLKQCLNKRCGLCWLDPTPTESDISRLYVNYFTHEIQDPRQFLLSGLRSILYAGYVCVTFVPSMMLGLNKARTMIRHMFLEDMKPDNLLDVGCGGGIFLHRMHRLGWSTTGLDFDPKAVENAKSRYGSVLTVLHSDLAGARFSNDSFSAITMSHVIEHVPDPVALLTESRRILKPGGRLVVTTPNIHSHGHEMFRDCWWGLDSPRHLQVFSSTALRECAGRAGFSRIKTCTTAANADTFMGGSYGFLESKKTGDCASGFRVNFNFIRGVRSLFLQYGEARRLRHDPECGEELVLICEK